MFMRRVILYRYRLDYKSCRKKIRRYPVKRSVLTYLNARVLSYLPEKNDFRVTTAQYVDMIKIREKYSSVKYREILYYKLTAFFNNG